MQRREGKQACKDTMGSYPIRDKSTLRDRFMLKHKHKIGTDLEAPVVWLLLGGGKKNKEQRRQKRDREGKRGEKESSVRRFVMS